MRFHLPFAAFIVASTVSPFALAQGAKPTPPAAAPAAPAPAKPKPKPNAPSTAPAAGTAPGASPDPLATPAPPPPWSGTTTPMSTTGTQLMPASPPAPAPVAVAPVVEVRTDTTLDNRFKMLEARVAADEAVARDNSETLAWLRGFKLTGYIQAQFLWQFFDANASPNAGPTGLPVGIDANDVIAKTDGTTTNTGIFRLRRARLKAEYMPTDYARFTMEIDPSPGGGAFNIATIARTIEAVGIVHWTDDIVSEQAVGIFKVPFGYELVQSSADRPFLERSYGEQNMFPGERDTGARISVSMLKKQLTGQVAVVNGTTLGEKNFVVLPDLNKGKDVVGRLNYNFGPFDVGASGYVGQGQVVDSRALRFKQYRRYAFDGEVGVHHSFVPDLGETRLFSEIVFGQNMDRGTKNAFAVPVIPTLISSSVEDQNERSFFVRVEQDVTKWATFAARYDFYTPDSSQKNNGRDTYGFVGVAHFTKGLKLLAAFDYAIDNIHRPGAPPASRHISTISGALQARF